MTGFLKPLLIGTGVLAGLILLGWAVDKADSKPKEETKTPPKSSKRSSPVQKKNALSPQQTLESAQKEITDVESNVEKLKVLASKETAKQNQYECLELEERLMQVQLKIDSVNELELKEEKKQMTRKIQSLLHVLDSIRDALSDSPRNNVTEDNITEIDTQPPILEVE